MQANLHDSLIHVTVNTAHSVAMPRDFVQQETYDMLAPLVSAGGGKVPNTFFKFSLVEQSDRVATIDFCYVREGLVLPAVVGTVCGERSEKWWEHLLRTARRVGVTRRVARPRSTPWLGVVLLPSPVWLVMSPEESGLLGSMENLVAWTWLRMREAKTFSGRN